MKPVSKVVLVGEIEGEVDHKTVTTRRGEAAVAEFYLDGIGLRISAWDKIAEAVPEDGIVVVEGYLNTRHYEYENKPRTSTDIRATNVQAIAVAPAKADDDDLSDLPF